MHSVRTVSSVYVNNTKKPHTKNKTKRFAIFTFRRLRRDPNKYCIRRERSVQNIAADVSR